MKDRVTRARDGGAADAPPAQSPALEGSRLEAVPAPGPEYLAAVVESADDAIYTIGPDGHITSWNAGAQRLYGCAPDDVMGEHVTILAGYANAEEAKHYLSRLLSGERIQHVQVERRHKDGRILFVSLTLSPVYGPDGRVIGASTVARDVSREREWEDRLAHLARRAERQAAFLDVVLRTTPDLLLLFDAEGRYMYASDSALRVTGLALDHLYGRTHADLIKGHELLDKLEASRLTAARKNTEVSGAVSIGLTAGRRHFTYTLTPVSDADGAVAGCLATLRDDTARRSAQAMLDEEKEFTDAVIGAAPGLFFATDRDGRLIRWNATAEQFAGLDTGGIAGTDTLSLVLEEDRPIAAAAIREAMETGASQVQLRLEGTQGVRDALITTRRTEIGGSPYLVGFVLDVTDRVKAEDDIRQARDELEVRVAERTAELQAANKRLHRTERALMTLSWSNQTLLEATDVPQLLRDVCTAAVEVGGYLMGWVGVVEDDEARTVRPVARAGHDEDFMDSIEVSWGESATGQGTVGRCVRSVSAVSVSDIERDPSYGPWREQALARGYRSALSLPLTDPRGVTWGVLCLFAGETGAFDDREVALLEELAMDLSFGVESIGVRAKREDELPPARAHDEGHGRSHGADRRGARPLHSGPRAASGRARSGVVRGDGAGRRHDRDGPDGFAPPRHREARRARRDPDEGGDAVGLGVRDDQGPFAPGVRDPEGDHVPVADRGHRAAASRAHGRLGIPGRPQGRSDTADGADHRGGRRRGSDGVAPALSPDHRARSSAPGAARRHKRIRPRRGRRMRALAR